MAYGHTLLPMDTKTFFEKLDQNAHPVVVDLWAPWCGPCIMVKPVLEKLAVDYHGRVDLWEINADENPDLLRGLRVYGVPTLIAYTNGKESLRFIGAKPAKALQSLFETLATGGVPTQPALAGRQRLLRLATGLALIGIGLTGPTGWFLVAIGAIVMFTAIHDRCPIWRALTHQYKKLTGTV